MKENRLFKPIVRIALAGLFAAALVQTASAAEWQTIFNGKDLTGWKVTKENPSSVFVKDGALILSGPRAHAFYNGPVADHNFTNFEFRAKVMTKPKANSGIYFHTEYQEEGWPAKGYECQVNNSHGDPKKTAGLYGVKDNYEAPVKDNEWFDYVIKVDGNHIQTFINGKLITDYTQPETPDHLKDYSGRKLSSGTFAFQAHDPESTSMFKDIQVKVLD